MQAALQRGVHHAVDLGQVLPDGGAFALFHVLPEGLARLGAIAQDLLHGAERINLLTLRRFPFDQQRAAAGTVHAPHGGLRTLRSGRIQGRELHAVGVQGQLNLGPPEEFHRAGGQGLLDGAIGQVATSCGRQAAVERYAEGGRFGMLAAETLGGAARSHRVAAGRAVPDAVESRGSDSM